MTERVLSGSLQRLQARFRRSSSDSSGSSDGSIGVGSLLGIAEASKSDSGSGLIAYESNKLKSARKKLMYTLVAL